jgi:hypothetical protein
MEDNGSKDLEDQFNGNFLNFFNSLNSNSNYSVGLHSTEFLNF